MKKSIFALAVLVFIFLFNNAEARTNVTDWYIKDFQSEIQVNKDSTLLITEKITADCGNATGKHGIFRTLPTVFRMTDKTISMPIELVGITDFAGKKLQYSTQNNYSNKTVTWKIGDPDRTVTGVNKYLITYKVKNVILFNDPNFDEFYWDLNGNFWELEMDNFTGKIIFPAEVTKNNTQVDYYTGNFGSKSQSGANYFWISDNVLQFQATGMLGIGEGITASVTFPKNIFTPYVPTFWEKYALYLWLIIPLVVFSVCFVLWERYGKDPASKKTIIAEFDAPEKLSPLELGTLFTNGNLKTEFITASIINLAVKKIIQIEETEKTGFLSFGRDYRLAVIDGASASILGEPESKLFGELFGKGNELMLSELKNSFYLSVPKIKKTTLENLEKKQFIEKSGLTFQVTFVVAGFFTAILAVILAVNGYLLSLPAMLLAMLIFFVFAFLMPKRTPAGAEVYWKTQGFKLYMETAEKYRAEFNEKENIFEKLLPYAIMFGMTKLWIKKMKEIYGENYFNSYHPGWFVGGSLASFDADSFASHIDNLSSAMASSVSTGSGAGGGGGSGGGGGGGGGGGW